MFVSRGGLICIYGLQHCCFVSHFYFFVKEIVLFFCIYYKSLSSAFFLPNKGNLKFVLVHVLSIGINKNSIPIFDNFDQANLTFGVITLLSEVTSNFKFNALCGLNGHHGQDGHPVLDGHHDGQGHHGRHGH